MRQASLEDVDALVELMADFYSESDYALNRERAHRAFSALLEDPSLGRVWLIDQDAADVGYVVATFVFAMEYGGSIAFVDDFFVRPESRNSGLGTAALEAVRDQCALLGVRAMSVEVAEDNGAAQAVYRHTGFEISDRKLMMVPLAAPTHER